LADHSQPPIFTVGGAIEFARRTYVVVLAHDDPELQR
jgi:hypothetical protein